MIRPFHRGLGIGLGLLYVFWITLTPGAPWSRDTGISRLHRQGRRRNFGRVRFAAGGHPRLRFAVVPIRKGSNDT